MNNGMMMAAILQVLGTVSTAPIGRVASLDLLDDKSASRKNIRKVSLRPDPEQMSEIAAWNAAADRRRADKLARRKGGA